MLDPVPEICGNGIDDDCKNGIDDGCANACGTNGSQGERCELATLVDDDCDGQFNEGCDVPACAGTRVEEVCTKPGDTPIDEDCDGKAVRLQGSAPSSVEWGLSDALQCGTEVQIECFSGTQDFTTELAPGVYTLQFDGDGAENFSFTVALP